VPPVPAWLDAPAPVLDVSQAEALANSLYGLRATATELYAERDRNFRLDLADGGRAVLKIANADADPAHLAFQVRALRHVAQVDPAFPAPRLIPTSAGQDLGDWLDPGGRVHRVRLLSWLPGEWVVVHQAAAAARRDAGLCLARLDCALRGCDPQGAPRELPWDLLNIGNLRALLPVLGEPRLQALANRVLDDFDTRLQAALAALPRQLIHNDLNPENLLFSPAPRRRVSGIIDFGDMVEAPLVCDLAVAAAYHLSGQGDPVRELVPLIRGFRELIKLGVEERGLLLPLVECGLLATLLIQGSRSGEGRNLRMEDLRPSAAEAAQRLLWIEDNRRDWQAERLETLLN